jgi:hypothetical protein
VRILGERRLAVVAPKSRDQVRLDFGRHSPRRFLPGDTQRIGICQLPDQTPAPMTDRFACAEVSELPQPPL